MKFSLIIATLNRADLLEKCLISIRRQTFEDYEIIIVDQSDDFETYNLVSSLKNRKILYFRVGFKGLSKARNYALKIATGDFFCLIDDDAWYKENYLEELNVQIRKNKLNVIYSGYIFDNLLNNDFCKYKKIKNERMLGINEVMSYCPSAALSFPISVYKSVGNFDEDFGVGSKYNSSEETDYLLRAIEKGYKISYCKNIRLNHPIILKNNAITSNLMNKKILYSKGLGALLKKHLLFKRNYLLSNFLICKVLKLGAKIILFNRDNALKQFLAIVDGFMEYK